MKALLAALLLLAITAAPVAAVEPDQAQWESDRTSFRVDAQNAQSQVVEATIDGKLTRLMLRVSAQGDVSAPLTVTVTLGRFPGGRKIVGTLTLPPSAVPTFPANRFVNVDLPPGAKVQAHVLYSITLTSTEAVGAYLWFGSRGNLYPWESYHGLNPDADFDLDFDFAFRTYVRPVAPR